MVLLSSHQQRAQEEQNYVTYNKYLSAIKTNDAQHLWSLLDVNDPHLADSEGRTALHAAAQTPGLDLPAAVFHSLGHHHVRTLDGLTPLDLARSRPYTEHRKFMLRLG